MTCGKVAGNLSGKALNQAHPSKFYRAEKVTFEIRHAPMSYSKLRWLNTYNSGIYDLLAYLLSSCA